ncbi:MAG TPA: hypothetical protein VHB54_21050 [Mucilaginibacter sp.]|nr:hypothetical protein [Mucilaginibacter sp.]
MLKRPAILLLLVLYFVTTSGFSLNLHYCFNQLSSVEIDAPPKPCAKNLATAKMKCCRNKHVEVKVKDSHQPAAKSSVSKIFNEELLFILTQTVNFGIPGHYIAVIPYQAPPDVLSKGPIYLANRNFRI